jgi:hypothetical protein
LYYSAISLFFHFLLNTFSLTCHERDIVKESSKGLNPGCTSFVKLFAYLSCSVCNCFINVSKVSYNLLTEQLLYSITILLLGTVVVICMHQLYFLWLLTPGFQLKKLGPQRFNKLSQVTESLSSRTWSCHQGLSKS